MTEPHVDEIVDALTAAAPLLGEPGAAPTGTRVAFEVERSGTAGVLTGLRAALTTSDDHVAAVDAFAAAARALRDRLGQPCDRRAGGHATLTWLHGETRRRGLHRRRPIHLTLELSTAAPSVHIGLRVPRENSTHPVKAAQPGPADAPATVPSRRPTTDRSEPSTTVPSGQPGDWPAYTRALAVAIVELTDDEFGILVAPGGDDYVQVVQFGCGWSDGLLAETAGSANRGPGRELSTAQCRRLAAIGFAGPDQDTGNWSVDLPWPATWSDYHRIASMLVSALRDVYGVHDPTGVTRDGHWT